MTKNRSLTAMIVVAVAVVVLTGGLMASNMGFKLNKTLLKGTEMAPSFSGTQMLGLPYNRQVGIDTAKALFIDIGDVQQIARYDTIDDTYTVYAGDTPPEGDFDLKEGVGYQVKMEENVNYIVVGSHNPAAVVQLEGGGTASLSGTNLYAPPYHATSATAKELFLELGLDNVQQIAVYKTASDTFDVYAADTPPAGNFNIVPGEAYQVKMETTLAFSPSHY